MATYPAIAATSQAIIGLLEATAPGSEFADVPFQLYGTDDLQKATAETTAVSLYLYRVSLDASSRNHPPRRDPEGRQSRPAVPLQLHYLLTAFSPDPAMQQRLLGWCVRVLEDSSTLPAGLLNHYGPETDVFWPDETVELSWEPLSTQDVFDVWEVARTNQQPSVGYVARVLAIESTIPLDEHPLVQATELRYGRVTAP